jgi:sugar/nucleoside kinase (ribokinase family)
LTARPDAALRTAVEYASRCAALSTERCGAATAPTRAEIVQRFGACVE